MPPLNDLSWGMRYETGIPAIDHQHKSLFRALRYLQEAISEGHVRAEVGVVLEFLEKYARVHFADEEAYMLRIGYPGLEEHVEEHRKFWSRAQELRERLASDPQDVALETSMMLFGWFRDHILIQDMAYVEHARRAGGSPG